MSLGLGGNGASGSRGGLDSSRDPGKSTAMPHDDVRPARPGKFAQATVWAGAAGAYAAAQGLSAWAGQRAAGRGTRPQYQQFRRPSFAPPGAAFPVAWSVLNLTTATSAWRVWRAPVQDHGQDRDLARPEPGKARREALAWWAAAVVVRSGYVPLAFGQRRLWAATADSALLCAMMTRYAVLARHADRDAALLALPEVAWTAFATVLSAAVAAGN
jgi:translocator protein